MTIICNLDTLLITANRYNSFQFSFWEFEFSSGYFYRINERCASGCSLKVLNATDVAKWEIEMSGMSFSFLHVQLTNLEKL